VKAVNPAPLEFLSVAMPIMMTVVVTFGLAMEATLDNHGQRLIRPEQRTSPLRS
jgi:hypothetical protein